jgi:hypothetical protein
MVSLSGFRKWLKLREQEKEFHALAIGITSSVDYAEDKHIILLDYDVKDFKKVVESVVETQNFWNLSVAFVYRTKNGYHVIFYFDQVPYTRLKMIIDYAKYVDNMFRYISKFYSHKTLRVVGKYKRKDIKFFKYIPGCRFPNKLELEQGLLKYREHCMMSGNEVVLDEKDCTDERFICKG